MSFLWGSQSFWRSRLSNQPAATSPPNGNQPTLASTEPTVPVPGSIDHLLPQNDANGIAPVRDKKTLEPLFGPNIGAVTSGPAWTASLDKKLVTDDLTPDVVSTWVEKSRDPSQPTTTLQALVNLKRPTIKLSPLHSDESEGSNDPSLPHGLEFEYDCDSAKCGLYVHVYLPKNHPDAPPAPPHHQYAKLLVFESVVDGGFGKHLKLDEGAILELGHFDLSSTARAPTPEVSESSAVPQPSANGAPAPAEEQTTVTFQERSARHRRRFTALRFRRGGSRTNGSRSISGPALAVVDAEPQDAANNATATEGTKSSGSSKNDDEGVKVVIRVAALDEQGTELANVNEQVTYLHIVRVGQKPAPANEGEAVEDTRPWVVKVVKREATIGAHTFHLHEIYGLTSSTTSASASHSYPPAPEPALNEDPQEECLLCLCSPREVVLLPCRHLVACKECALNMVEFGAGGTITQSESAGPAQTQIEEAEADPTRTVGEPVSTVANGPPPSTATTTAATTRRKRKAKGWFCPVCRQPYTSLLRITTAPPPFDPSKQQEGEGPSSNDNTVVDGLPTLANLSLNQGGTNAERSPRIGLLGMEFGRPGFLRSLTGRGQQPAQGGQVEMTEGVGGRPMALDVENVGGLGRTGS